MVTGDVLLKVVLDFTVQPTGIKWTYVSKYCFAGNKYKYLLNKDGGKPYLTLFHADISLAFSLSISSGSPVNSLPGSMVCGSRGPKLPWCSRASCLWFSTSSSCITPCMYCAALGETEFIALRRQSGTLQLIVATEHWRKTEDLWDDKSQRIAYRSRKMHYFSTR